MRLPSGTRGKQLDVRIQGSHLLVGLKGSPPIVDGDLHKPIKPSEEESYWTLEDNKEVTIFLQKVRDGLLLCEHGLRLLICRTSDATRSWWPGGTPELRK